MINSNTQSELTRMHHQSFFLISALEGCIGLYKVNHSAVTSLPRSTGLQAAYLTAVAPSVMAAASKKARKPDRPAAIIWSIVSRRNPENLS